MHNKQLYLLFNNHKSNEIIFHPKGGLIKIDRNRLRFYQLNQLKMFELFITEPCADKFKFK